MILNPTFTTSPLDEIFPQRAEVRVAHLPAGLEAQYADLERQVNEQPEFRAGQLEEKRIADVLRRRAPGTPIDLPKMPVRVSDYMSEPDKVRGCFQSGTAMTTALPLLAEARRMGCWSPTLEIPTFLSPQFVVSQLDKDRLIFDLRGLNKYTDDVTFRLDSLFDLPLNLAGCRYVSKLDLKSGFWQMAVAACGRLGFRLPDGSYGRWDVLPFGWSQAPRVFQQLTAAFTRAWRSVGVACGVYLDDFIWAASTLEQHLAATKMIVSDLLDAGLALSPKKTFLRPHHSLTYLGMVVDIEHNEFAVPADKRKKLLDFVASFLETGHAMQQDLMTFLGRAAFTRLVVPHLGFFTAHLSGLIDMNSPRSRLLNIDVACREELTFWLDHGDRLMRRPRPWRTTVQTRAWLRRARPGLKIQLTTGDLFDALASAASRGETVAAAHCVSRDFHMSKGIADVFERRHPARDRFRRESHSYPGLARVDNVVDYEAERRVPIYAVVNKLLFSDKPTPDSMKAGLVLLRDALMGDGIHSLLIPPIGCGLDGMSPLIVLAIIRKVFGDAPPADGRTWTITVVDRYGTFPPGSLESVSTGHLTDTPVARQDASETGIGTSFASTADGGRTYRTEPFPVFLMQWFAAGDIRASSTARELYGVARNLDTADLRPGTTVRVVIDNDASVRTARGTIPTKGTAWAARYLLSIAERRGLLLQTEWAPREQLADVDAGSRHDAQDLSRCAAPRRWLAEKLDHLWGPGMRPTTDLFADVGNTLAERFYSRFPQPGSSGEALSSPWTGARLWGFPPFALARLVATRAASGVWNTHQLILLLPDEPSIAFALRGWHHLPGPPLVLAPPTFTGSRPTPRLLRLFVSP